MALTEEPTIFMDVPCVRCLTCPECQGSHVQRQAIHELPAVLVSVEATTSWRGEGQYRVNGYEANYAAYELAFNRLNA